MSHQKPSNGKKQQGSSMAALHRQLADKKSKLVEEGFTFGMIGATGGSSANGSRPLMAPSSSRPPLAAVSPIPYPSNNLFVVGSGMDDTTGTNGRQLDFSVVSQRQQQEEDDHYRTLNMDRDDVVRDTANLHQLCAWPSSNSRRPQSNQHNSNTMPGDITNTSRLVMTTPQQKQSLSSPGPNTTASTTTTLAAVVESQPTSFRQELASMTLAAAHSQHRATPILKHRRRVTLEQEALLPTRGDTSDLSNTTQLSILPSSNNNNNAGSSSTTSKPLSLITLEKYISEQMTRLRFDFTTEYIAFQQQRDENLMSNITARSRGNSSFSSRSQQHQRTTSMAAAAGSSNEAIDWGGGGDPSVEGPPSTSKPSTAPSRHLGSSSTSRSKLKKDTLLNTTSSKGGATTTPCHAKRLLAPIAASSSDSNRPSAALALIPNNKTQVATVGGEFGEEEGLDMQSYLEARLDVFREAGRRFCDTFNTYRGPLEAILSEYDSYATHIGAAAHIVQSRLQNQTDQLKAENEALRNSIVAEQERRKVAESTVDGYVKRIAQLETDVRECVLQKELVEHDFHMASIRNKEGDHEKAVLTRKLMSLEDDIERLERELKDPRKETERLMGQLEAKASYITTLTHQQEKVNSEMAHLRRQLIIQLEKEAQRGRPVSPASRLRAVGTRSSPAASTIATSSSSVVNTNADGEREREAHGRTRAKLAQSQEYCAMLLSQLDRWKHLFVVLLGEHRSSSGISTKALDHGDLEISEMGVDVIASSSPRGGRGSGGNGGPFAYTFPLQKQDGGMGVATGGGAYGLNLPQQFKLYKGQSLLAAVKYLATTNSNQGGLSGILGGPGASNSQRNSIISVNQRKSELVDSTSSAPKSILMKNRGGGSSPPAENTTTAPHRRPTVAGGTHSSENLNLNSSRSDSNSPSQQLLPRKSGNPRRKSSLISSVSGGVHVRSSSMSRTQINNDDSDDEVAPFSSIPPAIIPLSLLGSTTADSNHKSADEDFDEMEFTPRPRGNFLNIQELNDAPSTAMKLAQAAQLIVELKLEASKLRREKDALVSLKSEEVNTAIAKLNDVYSSEGFGGVGGGGGGAYDNSEFRSVVSLADSNPISRWFVGVGDAATSSSYSYLRTVGRQRNQRFSLGTVKWHIHSFLQMSTSSAAASVVASLDKVLSAEAVSSVHHQSSSMALAPTNGGFDRRRSSLIPVMSSSVLASVSAGPRSTSPTTLSPSSRSPPRTLGGVGTTGDNSQGGDAAVARTFAVGGSLSGVLGAVGGGLGNPLTRCGDRLASRFASWMADRYGKDSISMCYSFHHTMDWFAPVDVDCHTFKAILDNTMTESLLKKQYLAAARLRNEMEKQGAQYIRRKLKIEGGGGDASGTSPTNSKNATKPDKKISAAPAAAGHPCVLPDGSMVTPYEVPVEVARKAILEVFGMWSKERQVELEQAMDVLDGGESIGINSMARKKKFGSKTDAPIDQWGNRTINLRKLFDNKTIGHGQMEAHFVTVLRTLWVVEAYEYTNQIIEVLLEDVTTVSGNVAPQTMVNSILQVDPNVPDHFLHEVVEAVFAPPGDVVVPLYLPDASYLVPITDRYYVIKDRDVTLPICISRLRMLLIMRHSVTAVPFPSEPQSDPTPAPPQNDGSGSKHE